MKRFLGSAALALALGLPAAAYAATSTPAKAPDTLTLRGVISAIDGKWDVTLHDNNGFVEDVALHRGTIIAPTGLRLTPGMQVSIVGYQNHATFDAERIVGPAGAQSAPGFGRNATLVPQEVPNGTFQTQGPTAAGGG
ncbi:MAG TPA: hypothetical protein VMA36_01990 [Candidatus Limnocylindria bacterium]|nr:hypothetical protein [Candidatus Limnocylindria bacterium]